MTSSVTDTNKKQYPLNGIFLAESIAYQANITINVPGYKEKVYLGVYQVCLMMLFCNTLVHDVINLLYYKILAKQRHKSNTELSKGYWKVE